MMKSLKKLALLLFLPLLTIQVAIAQPTGSLVFDFGVFEPVWDLSGPYDVDVPMKGAGGQEIPVVFSIYIDHQIRGALRGSGTTLMYIGDEVVAANYTISGSVGGGGEKTRANFSVSLSGRGLISGVDQKFNAKISFNTAVGDWGMQGKASGSVKMSKSGGGSIKVPDYTLPLPGGADGMWRLTLDYVPLKSFGGSGAVYVASYAPQVEGDTSGYRVFPGTIKGSYSTSKDLTKGKLTGTGSARGVSVDFSFYGLGDWYKGSAKILGQSIKF